LTNGEVLFPHTANGPQKYNFQFDYSYGVNLTVSDMLNGHIDAALKIKFLFFSKRWSKQIVSFKSGLSIGPLNLIGGGSYNDTTKQHQNPVPSDTKTWKSSYASVPFMGLSKVSMPTTFVADASYSAAKSSELFYDSLCKCDDIGAACNRSADCCDAQATCFGDPAQGGKHVCRECGNPNFTDTCVTDKDCCPGAICNQDDVVTCHDEHNPECDKPSTGGTSQLCLPLQVCTTTHPATAVCRPPPVDTPPTK